MANHEKTKGTSLESVSKAMRIRWDKLDEAPIHFSNGFLVQHNHSEFIISFAFVQPPNTLGLKPEEVAGIESLPANVQVRIVLSPERMRELSTLLNQSYEKYLKVVAKLKDSHS